MRKRYYLSKADACGLFGYTRQGYDKVQKIQLERVRRDKELLGAVESIRELDPGIGGYKLWEMSKSMFGADRVPGRDSFYKFLNRNDLVLPSPKPRRTTNSNHRFHKYKNLTKGFSPDAPNRLWVSDITYIGLMDGCCYLHLVTDAYSHKIVGWCLADSLMAVFTMAALQEAIAQTGKDDLTGLIHHSDRGIQYCCDAYVEMLEEHHISISMTEDYNPTDNAVAERVNGIIKTELLYRTKRFASIAEARERIGKFIDFYNNQRPHMSIGMKTPAEVHRESGKQKKLWKNCWLKEKKE